MFLSVLLCSYSLSIVFCERFGDLIPIDEQHSDAEQLLLYEGTSDKMPSPPFTVMKTLKFNEKTYLFIGARNGVFRYDMENKLDELKNGKHVFLDSSMTKPYPEEFYSRSTDYMPHSKRQTLNFTYDTCLSQYESRDFSDSVPGNARRDQGWIRFDANVQKFACENSFVRGLEKISVEINGAKKDVLWACGTFGSFPKALLLNPDTLEILNSSYDRNLPSCARWPDEQVVVTWVDSNHTKNRQLYVASGWGIYHPASEKWDFRFNNSTMMYSDWKMLWNGLHWPTRMAMMLGNEVRFVKVMDYGPYLYFFGHEVSPQYSYINALTKQAHQSFMIRICKNDTGFKYTAEEDRKKIKRGRSYVSSLYDYYFFKRTGPFQFDETEFSYTKEAWGDTYHLPLKHFTSALKFPFGCYLKRYDGAQSLNAFWGEQNIVYYKRLADIVVSFNWTDELTPSYHEERNRRAFQRFFSRLRYLSPGSRGMSPNAHLYNSMIGAFSSSGFPTNTDSGFENVRPSGAVCQFQLSEWKMDHMLSLRDPSPPRILYEMNKRDSHEYSRDPYSTAYAKNQRQYNSPNKKEAAKVSHLTAREEFIALYGTFKDSFYGHGRTWFQGLNPPHRAGIDFMSLPKFKRSDLPYLEDATKCGRCLSETELKRMNSSTFEKLMNYSTFAWPTDWFSHLSKYYDSFFHMNPIAVAGDNASFVMDNVEFSKMFVLEQNFTSYHASGSLKQHEAPLTYLVLVSTVGDVYRVVMCDLVSVPIRKTKCKMENTDQPYITPRSQAMRYNDGEKQEYHKQPQIRVSSLLSTWRITDEEKDQTEWEKMNPHSPVIKDASFDLVSRTLLVLTASRLLRVKLSTPAICDSYKSCVSCASDPFCYWDTQNGTAQDLETRLMVGKCKPYTGEPLSKSGIQDVMKRGEACQSFIQNITDVLKVCVSNTSATASIDCPYKGFFRGFIKWRYEDKENKKVEIDFDDDSPDFLEGPDNSLVIRRPKGSRLYECVGIGFDSGKPQTLMKFNVTVVESVMHECYCELLQKMKYGSSKGKDTCKKLSDQHCKGIK